jgi:hypothetical protein
MLTNPLNTAVAEQHRRDLITQASRSSRPRRLADLLRTRAGKKVRHGN